MKIAIVGPSAPLRGGIAQHTDRVLACLECAVEADLYAFARQYPRALFPGRSQFDDGAAPRPERREDFDPYRPSNWSVVADAIVARRPDAVFVQWWHPWFAPCVRGLLRRLQSRGIGRERLVVVCHNVLPHRAVPLQRILARSALREAGRFVVHARAEEERLVALLGGRPIVHRSALPHLAPSDHAPEPSVARAELGLAEAPTVLCFGLVRGYKGVLDAIAALPRMANTDARLLVAGEFYDDRARYERAALEHGVADRVRLDDGFVPESRVGTVFGAADVVALPYRSATQSAVLPLAFHYRRRFVATDVGGLSEASQGLGAIVPPRNAAALASALDAALAAGAVATHGAEADAWARANDAFSSGAVRDAYLRVASAARGEEHARRAGTPEVSVVVAAHGDCPHLEATLEALAAAAPAPPFETLVVYDGDPSALEARLPASGARLLGGAAQGLNAKRNLGLREARADLVLFTDDDCVPDPEWVAGMATALRSGRDVVTGAALPLGDGVRASVRESDRERVFRGAWDRLLPWRAGCGNNLGVRRAAALALGGFEERIGVGTWSGAACDTEFLFRALERGAVWYEPTAIVRHRQEPLGPATLDKRRRYYRGLSYMARRIHPRSPSAWGTALLRLVGTAGATALSAATFNRPKTRIHAAEFRGALEGFFPPREAVA